ncbi:MAG: translocation/assembly module TamB domain-containing protein [Conchiformibius sp.]|nr:translocation/assembly module TamB domain-containing protein [Conchiformibius sp.]
MSAPRPSEKPDTMPFEEIVKLARSRKETGKKPRRRCGWFCRILRVCLLLVLLVSAAAAGGAWWLLGTHGGLRFALFDLPQRLETGVSIRAASVRGTLWDGFSGEDWTLVTDEADIGISRLKFDWQPEKLWDKHLHIRHLAVGDIHIENKPVPPKPKSEPLKLPDSLKLPFTAALDKLEVGMITEGRQRTVLLEGLKAGYRYDHLRHRVEISALKTPWSVSAGRVSADALPPFALKGGFNSNGELDGIPIENVISLAGSLNDVELRTNLTGNGVGLFADTVVRPFAGTPGKIIGRINLQGQGINPQAFLSSLPQANLYFDAKVLPKFDGGKIGLDGNIGLTNDQPLPIDRNGIPVSNLESTFAVDESGAVEIYALASQLMKQGKVNLSGAVDLMKQSMDIQAQVDGLTAADLLAEPFEGKISGNIRATGTFNRPQAEFALDTGFAKTSGIAKLLTDEQRGQRTIQLDKGQILPYNGGKLALAGSIELFKQQNLQLRISSEAFNPRRLYPALPEGSVNGKVRLDGSLYKTAFHADMQFAPSVLSGAQLSGNGRISYENGHLSGADVALLLGRNTIAAKGSFGRKDDLLNVNIDAPDLKPLGFGIQGLLNAKGTVRSTADSWTDIEAALEGRVRGLNVPDALRIDTLDFKLYGSPDTRLPLDIVLNGQGIRTGDTVIDAVDAVLKGTPDKHTLQASGSLKSADKPLKIHLAAQGGLNGSKQWHGTVGVLDVAGALNLRLQNPLTLEAGAQKVSLSAARWQALGGSLNLEKLVWDKQNGLITKGSAAGLHFSELHNFYTPPVEHDLVLSGDWDLAYSRRPHGYINMRQQSGDITLPTGRNPKLGLNNLVWKTDFNEQGIINNFGGDTRYGHAFGNLDILQAFGSGSLADAPLNGTVRLKVAELNNLKNLLPTGQSVKGSLSGELQIGGTVNAPQLQGNVTGNNLYYRNRDVGVVLSNGSLQSRLLDRRWIVDALTFTQGKGSITLSGSADYGREEPEIDADITFNRYPVLDMPNRRLIVSGSGKLGYNGKVFDLDGSLKTDEGRFGFQDGGTPTLSDDVVVLGEKKTAEAPSTTPLKLNLVFDLNDRFYFGGSGLKVTLGGKLNLKADAGGPIRGVGSVNITKGQYKAYGQDLVIKKGVISFVGPLDNPNLNIRAERRNSPVGAGVEVLGNVNAPRVSLVASQPMSEKDKLSWLILNRASSGSSTDEAALSTAAGAFLAGSLNDKIGLVDNFGLTSQQTRDAQTGEMNPAQQVLTFGKQLTQDLYLGYEAGLGNASQSVKLVYQLSKSFQGILRAGTQSSGGELKYQKRFD